MTEILCKWYGILSYMLSFASVMIRLLWVWLQIEKFGLHVCLQKTEELNSKLSHFYLIMLHSEGNYSQRLFVTKTGPDLVSWWHSPRGLIARSLCNALQKSNRKKSPMSRQEFLFIIVCREYHTY